jgi:hypothetical protein
MFPVSFHTALQKLKVSKSVKATNMGTSSLLPAGFNHQADQLEVPLTLGKLSPYIFDDQNFSFLASYLWQGPSVRVKKVSRCFTYYVCIHNILTCMDYSDVQTATVYNKHVKKTVSDLRNCNRFNNNFVEWPSTLCKYNTSISQRFQLSNSESTVNLHTSMLLNYQQTSRWAISQEVSSRQHRWADLVKTRAGLCRSLAWWMQCGEPTEPCTAYTSVDCSSVVRELRSWGYPHSTLGEPTVWYSSVWLNQGMMLIKWCIAGYHKQ